MAILDEVLPFVSIVTSIAVIFISVGMYKQKFIQMEKDINNIGQKQTTSIDNLKRDSIAPLDTRLTEGEADRRHLAELFAKVETMMTSMDKRLDRLEVRLEHENP